MKRETESSYICDDRVYAPGGEIDQIRSMSDEEFERYIGELKKQEENRRKADS